eukprot:COSAG01_NODE_25510_length_742_cov_1.698289_1_plen_57_part_10
MASSEHLYCFVLSSLARKKPGRHSAVYVLSLVRDPGHQLFSWPGVDEPGRCVYRLWG